MVSLSRSRIADAVRPSVAPLWAQPASDPATTAIANAAVTRAPHARRDDIQCGFFCGPLIIVSLSMPLFVTADARATVSEGRCHHRGGHRLRATAPMHGKIAPPAPHDFAAIAPMTAALRQSRCALKHLLEGLVVRVQLRFEFILTKRGSHAAHCFHPVFRDALTSISACAPVPDDTGTPGQTSMHIRCDGLQGYPDCHSYDGTHILYAAGRPRDRMWAASRTSGSRRRSASRASAAATR